MGSQVSRRRRAFTAYSGTAIFPGMKAGAMVREARRRVGVTQEELARRVGTTQSAIARIERGRTDPSLRRVQAMVRACGLELGTTLAPADDADWTVAQGNLRLAVDDRVRQHQAALRFARAGRVALERRRARA
jgi:transcriptional regulator with XRE-family HTH domain